MKRSYKKLLSVLGAIAIAAPFTGCEADAEETNDASTNSLGASTSLSVTDTNSASADTNAATAEIGGTNVVNQQTTIIQRIPPTIPADVSLSKGVQEVVKLLQSGVSETVVLLFVEKSTDSFELDAADIVYLNDIGVPPTVLAAMLNHDGADPDILHAALNTNTVQAATAPGPTYEQSNYGAQAPAVEVSSNYVAAPQYAGPQYGGTPVVQDPNAQGQQQQVVVEQQPQVVVTQPAVTYSYFYNSLSPYGSWVYVADYGWCWQPTIAVTHSSWRPYVHGGRWLHSDAGWYWHSDYSWGWAPFHYGRWHSAPRIGWVWTPDYTWGPSWVTWRRGPDYCGWAPLPPRCYVRPGIGFSYWGRDVGFNFSFGYSHDYYTFVPTRRFCDRRVIDHVVPTHRTRNIYQNSTVVNNYIVGNNNTIINNGVGRDYVARHTREIPHVRVQESTGGTRVQPDRLVRNGAETVVYRPQRPAPTLVAAHEAAVARTRSETARATDNSVPTERGGAVRPIASRPGSSDALRTREDGGARLTSPSTTPRGASAGGRIETARPQLARGNTDVATPVFGTPAPVRPEPDRSAEILRSRTAQEARVRPSTSAGAGVGSVSTIPNRPSTAVRPTTPSRSIVPRYTQTGPEGGNAPQRADVPSRLVRPTTPGVSTQPDRPGRSEVARPTVTTPVAPATPVQRPNEAIRPRTELSRPTSVPSVRSPTANNTPAASPTFSRPSAPATTPYVRPRAAEVPNTTAPAPQVVRPQQPVAQSPAFLRPATSPSVPAPSQQPYVPPRSAAPAQPIQRQAPPVQTPQPAARPQIIQRREDFSRQSMPVQAAPPRTVVQPQRPAPGMPSAPAQRPSMVGPRPSAPAVSAPPARVAPSVNVSPAPASRGSFRSAPPAPASRPSAAPSSRGEGRGRVEIGR